MVKVFSIIPSGLVRILQHVPVCPALSTFTPRKLQMLLHSPHGKFSKFTLPQYAVASQRRWGCPRAVREERRGRCATSLWSSVVLRRTRNLVRLMQAGRKDIVTSNGHVMRM